MKKIRRVKVFIVAVLSAVLMAAVPAGDADWTLGPFTKMDEFNPILKPVAGSTFKCPVSGKTVNWENRYIYNPAAIVKDGKVYLLYRAHGSMDKKFSLASRIGLAWSGDGVHFTRMPEPVLYPDQDFMKQYEWPGGCEDPRIVEDESGTYYLTYTAFDGKIARLCVASSKDLTHWTKHGLALARVQNGKYKNVWSKSGAIVTEFKDGRQIAKKINGKYWMYWGDSDIFIATSQNLIDWTPVENEKQQLAARNVFKQLALSRTTRLLTVRSGNFDSGLVEPGPPPILTGKGIIFIYNSKNRNDPRLPKGAYAAGQALIDASDPGRVLARTDSYFIRPEQVFETTGQVNNVVFVEGLVFFKDRYFLYYGTADTEIGVAASPPNK